MSRVNGKHNIFLIDSDRNEFLKILSDVVADCGWNCHSYCLMDNHYHLLVETPEGRLSEGMQLLNGIYSGSFNRRHDKVGHVMQGRYKAPIIKGDNYFLMVLRYITMNPLKQRIVEDPADWVWSSYRGLAGLSAPASFLKTDFVMEYFSSPRRDAQEAYADYIKGAASAALSGDLHHCPSLDDVLESFDRSARDRAVIEAFNDYGYSMSEIADFLKVNCSTISRIINHNT